MRSIFQRFIENGHLKNQSFKQLQKIIPFEIIKLLKLQDFTQPMNEKPLAE